LIFWQNIITNCIATRYNNTRGFHAPAYRGSNRHDKIEFNAKIAVFWLFLSYKQVSVS